MCVVWCVNFPVCIAARNAVSSVLCLAGRRIAFYRLRSFGSFHSTAAFCQFTNFSSRQVATIGGNQAFSGLAQVQELRNAVADFRQRSSGRATTVAFADAFGEAGANGTITYYLASAFERVYMQPSGLLSMSGLASSTPFLRSLFDRWNVKPIFLAREEFKNVANQVCSAGHMDLCIYVIVKVFVLLTTGVCGPPPVHAARLHNRASRVH